jgi:hypothetical protein
VYNSILKLWIPTIDKVVEFVGPKKEKETKKEEPVVGHGSLMPKVNGAEVKKSIFANTKITYGK